MDIESFRLAPMESIVNFKALGLAGIMAIAAPFAAMAIPNNGGAVTYSQLAATIAARR